MAKKKVVSTVGWRSRRKFNGKVFGVQTFTRSKSEAGRHAAKLRKEHNRLARVTPVSNSRQVGTYTEPKDGYVVWATLKVRK